MEHMNGNEVRAMKEEAAGEVKKVVAELESGFPGITEGLATAIGASGGAASSFVALIFLGKVTGLSAAGITSGLAAAGSIIGGGMVAGIGVLAAPVAILGVAGYGLAKKRRNAKLAVALTAAIKKLYDIQTRLMQNAEYFKEEIAGIKATIDYLSQKNPAK